MSVTARQGAGCPTVDNPIEGNPIKGSVGIGGRNSPADVKMIQQLLNSLSPFEGGPDLYLKEDSLIGPKTVAAITKYQKFAFGRSDGRIDTNGPSIQALVGYIKTSPTVPYGYIGAPASAAQTSGTPNKGKTPSAEGADQIFLANNCMRVFEPRLGLLRWKLTRTSSGMMELLDKHFGSKFNKFNNSDVGHIQKILGGIHHYVARFNAFGIRPAENVILYSSAPPGKTIAWTVRGGDKMSTKQIQIYQEENGKLSKNPGQSIWLTSLFESQTLNEKDWTVLHEFAHFVGSRDGLAGKVDDHAYAHESHFLKISKFQKMHNAESLSLFFLECCIGTQQISLMPNLSTWKSHFDAFPKVNSTGDIVRS